MVGEAEYSGSVEYMPENVVLESLLEQRTALIELGKLLPCIAVHRLRRHISHCQV